MLELLETAIPGLLVLRLDVHADARGWFKENWQREKMLALGVPDFAPVQNNVSFNHHRGVTRGIHTEPWDKLVSVATGRVFAAWVDMRSGATFGTTVHLELDQATAVFVPRGVGNAYQTLEDATTYSYLVNDHWRPGTTYPALNLGDPTASIPWPIPLDEAEISDKDHANPHLDAVSPVGPQRPLIIGAHGQLGRALLEVFPDAHAVSEAELDITDAAALDSWPWRDHDVVINAAAYTAVDVAESADGRRTAWSANAHAPARLAALARLNRFTLVHYSTDYVFDGTVAEHDEEETLSPLGVYGQSKAAGDLAVASAPEHYLIRTSWVIGIGHNFVRTMQQLAQRGASPSVVADQFGRPTFTEELARATKHLLDTAAPYGTYNVSNSGPVLSWADLAREVFRLCGRDPEDVVAVTTEEYAAGRATAPRPRHSALDLAKLASTGFKPEDALTALRRYCASSSAGQRP